MDSFSRIICPAREVGQKGARRFYIIIELKNEVLHMHGIYHGSGQIYDKLSDINLIPNDGFDYEDIIKIQQIWKRWHLNDMRAGTPRQEQFIREWKLSNKYDYEKAREALKKANLLYDNGYEYGSSWLKEKLPLEIIKYLFSFPAICGDSRRDIVGYPQINEEEFFKLICPDSSVG